MQSYVRLSKLDTRQRREVEIVEPIEGIWRAPHSHTAKTTTLCGITKDDWSSMAFAGFSSVESTTANENPNVSAARYVVLATRR